MPDIGDRVRHIDEELNLVGTVIDVEGAAVGKASGWVTVQWDEHLIHQDELEADGTK
jgi:hypothetical protein